MIRNNLAYFTTRVPDTSDLSGTWATQLWHECNTNDTSATSLRHEQHECNTIATQEQYECYTNNTSATRVRNFVFDDGTIEDIFSHPYMSYMANEWWQAERQFHSKNYLLEISCPHAKMHLKSAPQKLNFVMTKAISKSYTLDCKCKCCCTSSSSVLVTHSKTASFLIKTTLYETNNIIFRKNYWKWSKMNARFWQNI